MFPDCRPVHARRSVACCAAQLALVVLAAGTTATAAGHHARKSAAVTSIQCWSRSDATRIVIEVTGEFRYSSDRVPAPDRIFFDFPDTVPELGKRGLATVALNDKRLRGIRVAETVPGVTRVVFDLAGGADFSTARLNDPERLVIELREPGASAGAADSSLGELVATLGKAAAPAPSREQRSVVRIDEQARSAVSTPAADAGNSDVRKADDTAAPVFSAIPSGAPSIAWPARRDDAGRRSITRTLDLKIGTIVVDAGHGGHDTGTVGPTGLMEKDLVLDIAQRLGDLIATRLGARIVYTRKDDTFVPLTERTRVANESHADLFLSIHANSSPLASTTGVETYYPNLTISRGALQVAERENGSSQLNMFELQSLIQNMAVADKVNESRNLAARVQTALYAGSLIVGRTRDRGVRKAPFIVLLGADMPSVLAEIGFISNADEEQLMRQPEQRQRIAEALCAGVQKYAASLSHFDVTDRAIAQTMTAGAAGSR